MEGRRYRKLLPAGLALAPLVVSLASARGQSVSPPMEFQPSQVSPVYVQEQEPSRLHGLVNFVRGYADPENAEVVSVHQLACLVAHLEKCLQATGQVVVKGPDVWGQNRLTQHRAEYEDQMRGQLASFELILNSYQRRADLAALTSATSVGASLAPRVSNSRNVSTTTNVSPSPTIPSAAGLVGPNGLVANANTLLGDGPSPLLMPSNLTALALANKGTTPGIGLEPTVVLDERSRFLNHLEQLRRINIGDDRTDMPGYGLYLVRTPVSVLPGAATVKGKGATVTVQAYHHLSPDLLANTFRNVVIMDTTYQLLDAVTRGQYLGIEDVDYERTQSYLGERPDPCTRPPMNFTWPPPPPGAPGEGGEGQSRPPDRPGFQVRSAPSLGGVASASKPTGGQGAGPGSEVAAIYGAENLRRLVAAVNQEDASWYRHDPSIVGWLMTELTSAHAYMREQARLGNPAFQADVFDSIGSLVMTRSYKALRVHRQNWLLASAQARHDQIRPIDVLAFALIVQSAFVDRQLKIDMQTMAERNACGCGDVDALQFHGLIPSEEAKHAFRAYVACKWPIHVFSLDPVVEQQNQLDLFSQRTELQLALAVAISTGQASVQNATTYARRLEQDLAAIGLNRVAVGFGAGEATYGWRFYPRIQTPPTESNPSRIANILLNNGPGPNFAMKNARLEPGLRECYALIVVPNFVPAIKLTTVTNWFDLSTKHPDQMLEATDMVHLGRKLQTARNALQRLCDSGRYRPIDVEALSHRLDQLESMLPIQSFPVSLPFEADLTGSELFNSNGARLAPRLLTWYGEPARPGGSVFLVGSGFTVHEMKVIVGGVTLKEPSAAQPSTPGAPEQAGYDIMSRNVLRIDIPKDAAPIDTATTANYPRSQKPAAPGTAPAPTAPPPPKPGETECKSRRLIDVHVATPNGVSNHMLIEIPPETGGTPQEKTVKTSVTTTTAVNPATGTTTTKTDFETTPPGIVLPHGTFLPMGGGLPAGSTFVAPGAATFQSPPMGFPPGTVPNTLHAPAVQPEATIPHPVQSTPTATEVPRPAAWRPDPPPTPVAQSILDPNVRPASFAPAGAGPGPNRVPSPRPGLPAVVTSPSDARAEDPPHRRRSILSRVLGGSHRHQEP